LESEERAIQMEVNDKNINIDHIIREPNNRHAILY